MSRRRRRVVAHYDMSQMQYGFFIAEEDVETGERWGARNMEMVQIKPGQFSDPTFRLNEPEAQELMDCLWRAGLRPKDASSGSEVIQAMKDHIADLRESHKVVVGRLTPSA